jgi:hypothetical protein
MKSRRRVNSNVVLRLAGESMEEKYKIHAYYIIGILIAVIVILVSVKWANIPNLANVFSFGLTFASLLLAVLAIGYSVHSTSSFSHTIESLNNATKDISLTSHTISTAATDLAEKVEAIPTRLEAMEGKFDQTREMLQKYSQQVTDPPPKPEEKKAASEIVDLFLNRASINGLLYLYSCHQTYLKKIPVLFNDYPGDTPTDKYYGFGFLIATYSAGLLDYSGDKTTLTVTRMDEKLANGIVVALRTNEKRRALLTDYDSVIERRIKSIDEVIASKLQDAKE